MPTFNLILAIVVGVFGLITILAFVFSPVSPDIPPYTPKSKWENRNARR